MARTESSDQRMTLSDILSNTTSVLPTVSVRSLAPDTAAVSAPTMGVVSATVAVLPTSDIILPTSFRLALAFFAPSSIFFPAFSPASPGLSMASDASAAPAFTPSRPSFAPSKPSAMPSAALPAACSTLSNSAMAAEPSAVTITFTVPALNSGMVSPRSLSLSQLLHQPMERFFVQFRLFHALAGLQVLPALFRLHQPIHKPVFMTQHEQVAGQPHRLVDAQPRVFRHPVNRRSKLLLVVSFRFSGDRGELIVGFERSSLAQSL